MTKLVVVDVQYKTMKKFGDLKYFFRVFFKILQIKNFWTQIFCRYD